MENSYIPNIIENLCVDKEIKYCINKRTTFFVVRLLFWVIYPLLPRKLGKNRGIPVLC